MPASAQEPPSSAGAGRREVALAAVGLVLFVFAAFQPALGAGFVNWDDPRNLLENPHFRGLSGEHLKWMFTTRWLGPYQPLSWLSLAIDHQLWGLSGPLEYPEAGRYHLTNVLLHAGAALACFAAARRLFARLRPAADGRARLLAAWAAAALFALHPLRVESVAWVTERRDVLSGLFFALALWAWFGWVPTGARERGRSGLLALGLAAGAMMAVLASLDLSDPEALSLRGLGVAGLALGLLAWCASAVVLARATAGAGAPRRYLACGALFAASLLSKGTGMTLPVALLVLDLWPLRRLVPRSPRVALDLVLEKAPLLALSALTARIAVWGQGEALVSWSDHTLSERLVQSAYALVWYAWKTLLPSGLSAMHELPAELPLTTLRFALPVVVLALGLAAALVCLRRAPLVPAVLAAYAVLLAPVVGISQAGAQIVAERYSYLPALPLALGLGGGLLLWLERRARLPAASWIVGVAAGLPLVLATHRLSATWRSSETLWEHALRVDPLSPAAHQFLGLVRRDQVAQAPDPEAKRARLREAAALLERGYELGGHPKFLEYLRDVYIKAAGLALDGGASEEERALDYSRRWLAALRAEGTLDSAARLQHAELCLRFGRAEEARDRLAALARDEPESAAVWLALGAAQLGLGAHQAAAEALAHALALDGDSTTGWLYLARSQEALGESSLARASYRRVLELEPAHLAAREALARLPSAGD